MFRAAKAFQILFHGTVLSIGICFIGLTVFILTAANDLPRLPQPLSRIIETPQTRIYAASGQRLTTLGERESIPLNMVSKDFINAILAVEDHRFYDHQGINKLRTLKALYITLFKQGEIQGASTITQQLAKNLFFSFKKSYMRKFKELLVSFQIESTNSKKEILHAYINQIHFGAGAQGIEKASKTFFGKSASDLNLSEAALLAGLPKSPTGYNPFRHYEKALQRRKTVLTRMKQVGFINEHEFEAALEDRPELSSSRTDSRTGSYFLDAVIQKLVKKFGEDVVYHGGIKVYTTMDKKLQDHAVDSVNKGLKRLEDIMGLEEEGVRRPQGALVSIDTDSGAVKAMVGGRDYYESEFNRALDNHRQPGSGFKPFLYYTAFEKLGMHPASVVTDKPISLSVKGTGDWQPRNFSRTHRGDIILKKAMTKSVNTVAARLVRETGPDAVIETAKLCGIKSPLERVYSVALGTSPVSVKEMAAAFSTFAKEGIRHDPFMIWRIEDHFGSVLEEHIVQEKQVLEPDTAYQVLDMMKSVIDRGSGSSVRKLGFDRPAAGKTGTTDGFNDAWFTGFTPTLCTSVWTGFDKRKKMLTRNGAGITGGKAAAPIWAEFMTGALKDQPKRDFTIPESIRFQKVDTTTGCPAKGDEKQEVYEVALKKDQNPCSDSGTNQEKEEKDEKED